VNPVTLPPEDSPPGSTGPTPLPPAVTNPPPQAQTDPAYWAYTGGTYGHVGPPKVTFMAQGGEVDQPTPAMIGEKGPEAVVPLTGLLPHEQMQVHGLIAAARARMGNGLRTHFPIQMPGHLPFVGGRPPVGPHMGGGLIRNPVPTPIPTIHWFGPGGSGVWSPPPRPVDPGPVPPLQPPPSIIEGFPPMMGPDPYSWIGRAAIGRMIAE
jgi:hypothetical protein